MLKLTAISKDALGLFLWSMRDKCAYQVVGKGDHEDYKEQNLGLRDRSKWRDEKENKNI